MQFFCYLHIVILFFTLKSNVELYPEEHTCQDVQISIQNRVTSGTNFTERCDEDQVSKLKPDDRVRTSPLHIVDGNLQVSSMCTSFPLFILS